MVVGRRSRTEVEQLIASCEVISEFAAESDMPEVSAMLLRLLFVLTDGVYGSTDPDGDAADPDRAVADTKVVWSIRNEFRAFGRGDEPG